MINQESLKSQIIKALWQLIIDGDIKPNEPLREIHLAELLTISRTPLREALQQLEWEGILISEPRKGFRLSKFSVSEVLDIYPLRAKLESFALELSGIPPKKVIDELSKLNAKMRQTKSPKNVVKLDEQWHLLLISNCSNMHLLKMIKILHRQSQRYEYAYMNIHETIDLSTEQHEQIITQLKEGQLQKATELFAQNNLSGVETLTNWLQSEN